MLNCQDIFPDCDLKRWECIPTSVLVDAENYPTKVEMSAYTYSKGEVDEMIDSYSGVTTGDVQTMIDEAIEPKADKADVYNKVEINAKFENFVWVDDQGILHFRTNG